MFRVSAVGLGLVGVLIVISPRLSLLGRDTIETTQALGVALVLMSAVCAALAQIYIRKLVQFEQTAAIVFYFSITSTVLSLLTLPFGWVIPSATECLLLILAGLLGGTAQIFLTSAYRFADASVVAPFDYASMIFALLIGFFIFGEVPTGTMLIGAGIVVLARTTIGPETRQGAGDQDATGMTITRRSASRSHIAAKARRAGTYQVETAWAAFA